jgi:hypothetical protein
MEYVNSTGSTLSWKLLKTKVMNEKNKFQKEWGKWQ